MPSLAVMILVFCIKLILFLGGMVVSMCAARRLGAPTADDGDTERENIQDSLKADESTCTENSSIQADDDALNAC